MTQSLEVIAVLANVEHGDEKNTVLELLGSEIDDFHVFKFVPEPGVAYASVNWRGVLGDAANVAGIASLLWTIYSTNVCNCPEPEPMSIPVPSGKVVDIKPKPSLIIQLKGKNNEFEQFNISGNYESKEIFIKEFTDKVERLRASEGTDNKILETFEHSERWIRIK